MKLIVGAAAVGAAIYLISRRSGGVSDIQVPQAATKIAEDVKAKAQSVAEAGAAAKENAAKKAKKAAPEHSAKA